MAYIKLGPIGDYFASNKLGIYLNDLNAVQVSDSLLTTQLVNFLITGFIVRIDQLEYENIKLEQRSFGNMPLAVVGIYPINVIEPIDNVVTQNVANPVWGQRYLIMKGATGEWEERVGYIAEFDGNTWDYTEPKDGMIVPVYALGLSAKYTGTYPSGYWTIADQNLTESSGTIIGGDDLPIDTSNWAERDWTIRLIESEAEQRSTRDNELYQLIMGIQLDQTAPSASQVSITDNNNNFNGGTVELALSELAQTLYGQTQSIELVKIQIDIVQTQIVGILGEINNLKGQTNSTQKTIFIYNGVDEINLNHNIGSLPIWQLYEVINPETVET